jgi:hypothetical protein
VVIFPVLFGRGAMRLGGILVMFRQNALALLRTLANTASKLTLKVSNRSDASLPVKEVPGFGWGFPFVDCPPIGVRTNSN